MVLENLSFGQFTRITAAFVAVSSGTICIMCAKGIDMTNSAISTANAIHILVTALSGGICLGATGGFFLSAVALN